MTQDYDITAIGTDTATPAQKLLVAQYLDKEGSILHVLDLLKDGDSLYVRILSSELSNVLGASGRSTPVVLPRWSASTPHDRLVVMVVDPILIKRLNREDGFILDALTVLTVRDPNPDRYDALANAIVRVVWSAQDRMRHELLTEQRLCLGNVAKTLQRVMGIERLKLSDRLDPSIQRVIGLARQKMGLPSFEEIFMQSDMSRGAGQTIEIIAD